MHYTLILIDFFLCFIFKKYFNKEKIPILPKKKLHSKKLCMESHFQPKFVCFEAIIDHKLCPLVSAVLSVYMIQDEFVVYI